MKKNSFMFVLLLLLMGVPLGNSSACVNLDINIGTIDSVEGKLFADIISTFIHERTGTKSIIRYYPNISELNEAIADKKIELILVNIADSLLADGQEVSRDAGANFATAKKIYKKGMQLVMLDSFGTVSDDSGLSKAISPVLAPIVLEKFPALPRLLKKLLGKIDSETTSQLLALVRDQGEKSPRVAKDFLVAKKLI